jgi:hypothetical protein
MPRSLRLRELQGRSPANPLVDGQRAAADSEPCADQEGSAVAYEKILILESTWANDSDDYIRDSRSTARIYLSFESLLSLHDVPVFAVHRPLLAARYLSDIRQFVSLPANKTGVNIVILSAHGSFKQVHRGDRLVNKRRLHAIDGEVKLSSEIRDLSGILGRTVFILDACDAGSRVDAFRSGSGALGAIGFSKSVNWVDSAAFVLALLLHMQSHGIFQRSRRVAAREVRLLVEMLRSTTYESLASALGLEVAWAAQG